MKLEWVNNKVNYRNKILQANIKKSIIEGSRLKKKKICFKAIFKLDLSLFGKGVAVEMDVIVLCSWYVNKMKDS